MSTIVMVLSEEEASYIKDVLDWWLEGYEEATNDVIQDRSLESPDDLLQAVSGMYQHHDMAASLKNRLTSLTRERTS